MGLPNFEIYRIQLDLAENRQNIRDSKTKIVNRHLGKISQKIVKMTKNRHVWQPCSQSRMTHANSIHSIKLYFIYDCDKSFYLFFIYLISFYDENKLLNIVTSIHRNKKKILLY